MTERNDFNPDRDPALGERLRDHFAAADDASFTRRVMARIALEARPSSWDVLAGWAPLGFAAAAILALAAGLGLGLLWRDITRPAVTTTDPVGWLSSSQPATSEFVLTAVLAAEAPVTQGDQR